MLLPILNLIFIGFLCYQLSKRKTVLQKIFWPALIVKFISGIVLGLLYTYYYHVADTFGIFNDGTKMSTLARTDFISYLKFLWDGNETFAFWPQLTYPQPRALFLSKIVSVFCLLTKDNYWIISLYFSLISFVCSWQLVQIIVKYFPDLKIEAAFSFLFIPSVVFWSSGLMKECLAMATLFFLTIIVLKIWFKEKVFLFEIFSGVFAFWILWQLKYYFAGIFLPVVISGLLVKFLTERVIKKTSVLTEMLLWGVIIGVSFFGVVFSKENFHPHVFFNVIVKNYNEFHKLSSPGDAIVFGDLTPDTFSIVRHSPWALVSGIFRPFIWEVQNWLQVLVSLENIFLFVIFVFSVKNWKRVFTSSHRLLIFSMVLYVVLLCIFLTLSTPNFGTLSRYRVGFLPILFFLLSIRNPFIHYLYNSVERLLTRIAR